MVYEDLIYGVFNGENSSRKTFKSVAEGKNWLRVKNNERKNVLIRNDVWTKNRELKGKVRLRLLMRKKKNFLKVSLMPQSLQK